MITERLQQALRARLTDDGSLDLDAELAAVLADAGLKSGDCGGRVSFAGADPIVPSTLALAAGASIALVAKSVAIAALWRHRDGGGQDISMDLRKAPHRLCPFYDDKWELLNGYPQSSDFGLHTALRYDIFYRTADGRWVLPQAQYPRLRIATLKLLRTYDDRAAVAHAVAGWKAADLEQAAAQAGVVIPHVRTTREFMLEPQYPVLAQSPLVAVERICDGPAIPFPAAACEALEGQPLAGFRALGMGHVIAGGGIGRTLALHGADVLNIWRPYEYESPASYHTAQFGVRSARIDPFEDWGRSTLRRLARTADIFYANRRHEYLRRIGFTAHDLAEVNPGIIHVTVSTYGDRGPWALRPGFDHSAGCVTGIMTLEGNADNPRIPVITVVNDWIAPWLAALGIVSALIRRSAEGGSYRVHVSLSRIALWLISLGVFDKEYAVSTAGTGENHLYLDPDIFFHDGPTGRYKGVTEQVRMSVTPGRYRFGLLPLGSCEPHWLDDESRGVRRHAQ